MLFQKDTAKTTDLQFIWNADEALVHNAASQQRDYLFQDEWGQDLYQGQIATGGTTTTGDINDFIDSNEAEKIINNNQPQEQIYTGTINTWTETIPIIQKPNTTEPINCITPWNETVKDKDFILAYEQRKDVGTICNIEKRICTNGVLWGTFTQRSCKDDIVYTYRKAEVISYNQKILNENIQPSAPVNEWAQFDTEGKIDTTEIPTTTRWTSNSPTTTQTEVTQNPLSNKANCMTPRRQEIEHGQFVKAYKAPRGFIDLPCEVELRACINGNLKGSFTYSKCTFNNTTYSDYLNAGSPRSATWFIFFDRIKSIFRR